MLANDPQRMQQQLDLFESLERELKSIIEVFSKERSAKKREIQNLKMKLGDKEEQMDRELDKWR